MSTKIADVSAHLVQLNVATLLEPIDHPASAEFANALELVNSLGEQSDGFIWRLKSDRGDATDITLFPNPLTIVNMTVWASIQDLKNFAYRGVHLDYFKRRGEWFDPTRSQTALWWIAANTLPTTSDALARLRFMARYGTSAFAFQMGQQHPTLTIDRTDLHHTDSVRLIEELDQVLSQLYPEPGATHFMLSADQIAPGHGGFFVARLDGLAVGCAAYRHIGQGRAEVKRMYTNPSARGLRVGAALLAQLEVAAMANGITQLVLETGERQPEAWGLYSNAGFERCECWGEYIETPSTSRCFSKQLQ